MEAGQIKEHSDSVIERDGFRLLPVAVSMEQTPVGRPMSSRLSGRLSVFLIIMYD